MIFLLIFILKPFRNEETFIISRLLKVQIWFLGEKKFFFHFLVNILPLGSVDPHIFADPDPGSQNLADPTDPDPKHCSKSFIYQIGTLKNIISCNTSL